MASYSSEDTTAQQENPNAKAVHFKTFVNFIKKTKNNVTRNTSSSFTTQTNESK